jgi:hypothetical protein
VVFVVRKKKRGEGKHGGRAFIGWNPRKEGSTGGTKALGVQGINH